MPDYTHFELEAGLWDGMSPMPGPIRYVTNCPNKHYCGSWDAMFYYCPLCNVLYMVRAYAR